MATSCSISNKHRRRHHDHHDGGEHHEDEQEGNHAGDDPINDEKEKEHFRQVVESFRLYNFYATKRVTNRLKDFRDLSPAHKSFLFDFEDNCRKLIDCIKLNDQVIDLVLKDVDHMFENTSRDLSENEEKKKSRDLKAHQDVDRVYTTLKQIVRDWSVDGERERACCYGPILDELKTLYPLDSNQLAEIKVLVPGAGLGRLAFEIAVLGFKSQGNEFSLHMLIMSNFILNKCRVKNQYKVYPYVNTWCNNWSFDSQVKPVHFPDVAPCDLITDTFSFSAGDFLDIYVDKDEWNSVVTCFFIDTAHNVIEYVEKIWSILKPNGYWINFGPLLYHFADTPNEKSIELSFDQLKHVMKAVGFKFLKENLNMPSTYLENAKSMLKYSYECVFFVVQKPA